MDWKTMEPHYVNPFISAAVKLIKKTTGLDVAKKNVYLKKGKESFGGCGIVLDIEGDLNGKIAYEFSRGMLMQLSSRMIKRSRIEVADHQEFLKLLKSAMAELGNLISGRAITYLQETGFNCDITPPEIYVGQGVILIPDDMTTFVIELQTHYGDFVINLALKKIPQINENGEIEQVELVTNA